MQDMYCQSCGMPLTGNEELLGTNQDGSKNKEYCKYCYTDGKFTSDCTMDEMIEYCVQPMVDNNPDMTAEKAREMMKQYFPTLKRWKRG